MQDEAEITISGVKLTHDESMTIRVAMYWQKVWKRVKPGL
jgi:hypothetical protein